MTINFYILSYWTISIYYRSHSNHILRHICPAGALKSQNMSIIATWQNQGSLRSWGFDITHFSSVHPFELQLHRPSFHSLPKNRHADKNRYSTAIWLLNINKNQEIHCTNNFLSCKWRIFLCRQLGKWDLYLSPPITAQVFVTTAWLPRDRGCYNRITQANLIHPGQS